MCSTVLVALANASLLRRELLAALTLLPLAPSSEAHAAIAFVALSADHLIWDSSTHD
jgi:hypothetical protein